ncbi:MAG: hypothetical protein LH472_12475 [Pyrinomonadaceae bacterium]|nr:hypothetical protein [Pyrinomonadaceae bacterium]
MSSETPDLPAVFRVLREMTGQGVIADYAVGGAVAAIFYIEPRETFDLDIFFVLGKEPSSELRRLEAIYEFAARNGFEAEAEYIKIHGWAVQFLESVSALWKEAVAQANELKFENETARVMRPEHLAALMAETGRRKDWLRLADFIENDVLDVILLKKILRAHDLEAKWNKEYWRFGGDEGNG